MVVVVVPGFSAPFTTTAVFASDGTGRGEDGEMASVAATMVREKGFRSGLGGCWGGGRVRAMLIWWRWRCAVCRCTARLAVAPGQLPGAGALLLTTRLRPLFAPEKQRPKKHSPTHSFIHTPPPHILPPHPPKYTPPDTPPQILPLTYSPPIRPSPIVYSPPRQWPDRCRPSTPSSSRPTTSARTSPSSSGSLKRASPSSMFLPLPLSLSPPPHTPPPPANTSVASSIGKLSSSTMAPLTAPRTSQNN